MSALLQQAERLKLARLLDCEVAELGALGDADVDDLRLARSVAGDALFGKHRSLFGKLARANRLLPTSLAAQLTQRFVGPMLAGRVASEMDPDKAVALAGKLPVTFLAQVCLYLDPARSEAIIRAMPTDRVVATAEALRAEGEYIAMAGFADVLDDAVVAAVMDAVDAPADLLRIGFYIADKQRLAQIIGRMDDDQLAACMRAAHDEALWPQALAMMDGTSEELRARLGAITADQDAELLHGMLDAAAEQDMWLLTVPVLEQLDESALTKMLADAPALSGPSAAQRRERLIAAVEDADGPVETVRAAFAG